MPRHPVTRPGEWIGPDFPPHWAAKEFHSSSLNLKAFLGHPTQVPSLWQCANLKGWWFGWPCSSATQHSAGSVRSPMVQFSTVSFSILPLQASSSSTQSGDPAEWRHYLVVDVFQVSIGQRTASGAPGCVYVCVCLSLRVKFRSTRAVQLCLPLNLHRSGKKVIPSTY